MAAPPPPGTPGNAPVNSTSDESQDSGLGLEWVYINGSAGASYVDMESFSTSSFGLQKTHAAGPAFGVAAGVRLLFFTLGVNARDLILSSIGSLWLLDAEAAFHMRIWRIDPYFGVRGGYAFVGSLSSESVSTPTSNVDIHGFNVGPVAGIDFYLSSLVSIGADVDAQFLFLQRPPVPLPAGVDVTKLPPQDQVLYKNSGNSVGLAVTPTAHLGIHF